MSPKLSDALRGMADRAPIGEVSVSAPGAARRVRRHRAVRVTANSLVGAGAVAVVAFAVIAPSTGNMAGDGDSDLYAAPAPAAEEGMAADTRLAMNMCGGGFTGPQPDQPATLAIASPDGQEIGDDRALSVEVTLTAVDDIAGQASPTGVLVLWEGVVVGSASPSAAVMTDVELAAGNSLTETVALELVNCWDGTELPGGKYQIAATQAFFTATPTDPVAPDEPLEPSPADGGEVAPELVDPPMEDAGTTSSGADASITFDAGFTLVSEPIAIVIEGDVPQNPFGNYIDPPQPELPDGYLTPDIARELYAASVTDGAWDMAAGSQRVVLMSDALVPDPNGTNWADNYFGCTWDGGPAGTFPARSAELDLFAIDATIPTRANLSYGWVVDGNPEVQLQATNTSGYSLPAMYEPSSSLVLVRDGRVVAEAYLSNTDRSGGDYNFAAQYMEPGATVGGTYLWREVSGCWNGNLQADVPPGNYTVLNAQYVYLGTNVAVAYSEGDMGDLASSQIRIQSDGVGEAQVEPVEPAIWPGVGVGTPDAQYDYVELQVWTSLGTVTITN